VHRDERGHLLCRDVDLISQGPPRSMSTCTSQSSASATSLGTSGPILRARSSGSASRRRSVCPRRVDLARADQRDACRRRSARHRSRKPQRLPPTQRQSNNGHQSPVAFWGRDAPRR
jgi:hypothetical protein